MTDSINMSQSNLEYMSPEDYVSYKYQQSNIILDLIWNKINILNNDEGALWWNGVSSAIPHPCSFCQEDNTKFKQR